MGAGFHGGFGSGTKGAEPPVSKNCDVRYSKKKSEEYLLNENHPSGGSKAKFMKEVLGYSKEDSKLFHKNVVSAIKGKMPEKTTTTQYGIKHTYHVKLVSKDGSKINANVVVVIQKDKGRTTYKLVTVYPDKKEK
ncbi:MAG: hypothetical protein MJ074_02850 [Oscillospiraceae bacterium]|nr:hypothetical protein [Oscillospiraceae bacterium]